MITIILTTTAIAIGLVIAALLFLGLLLGLVIALVTNITKFFIAGLEASALLVEGAIGRDTEKTKAKMTAFAKKNLK